MAPKFPSFSCGLPHVENHWLTLQAPCGNFSGIAALREACRTVLSAIVKELPSAKTDRPHLFIVCNLLSLMNFCISRDEQVESCNGGRGGVVTFGTNFLKLLSLLRRWVVVIGNTKAVNK